MHEKMRISKGRDRADVKSDSKKFFFTQQLRSYISQPFASFTYFLKKFPDIQKHFDPKSQTLGYFSV